MLTYGHHSRVFYINGVYILYFAQNARLRTEGIPCVSLVLLLFIVKDHKGGKEKSSCTATSPLIIWASFGPITWLGFQPVMDSSFHLQLNRRRYWEPREEEWFIRRTSPTCLHRAAKMSFSNYFNWFVANTQANLSVLLFQPLCSAV